MCFSFSSGASSCVKHFWNISHMSWLGDSDQHRGFIWDPETAFLGHISLLLQQEKQDAGRSEKPVQRSRGKQNSSGPCWHGFAYYIMPPFRNLLESNCCYQHRWQIKVLFKTRSAQVLPQTDLQKPIMDRGTKTYRTAPLCWSPVGIYSHPRTQAMARGRALGSPRNFWEALLFPMITSSL